MAWVKLDDHFADHPKMAAAGPLAMLLHVKALCYCARYLTDGFVPDAIAMTLVSWELHGVAELGEHGPDDPRCLPRYPSNRELIEALVEVGAWELASEANREANREANGVGYVIHDYLEYQPSRAEVLAERAKISAARSAAGKVGGAKSAESRRNAAKQTRSKQGSKPEANAKQTGSPVPDPDPLIKRRESARAPAPKRGADAAALCDVLASRAELFGSADLIAVSARLEVTLEGEPKADRLDRRQVGRELVADVEAYGAKYPQATPEQRVAQLSRKLAWILGDVASGKRKDAQPRHDPSDGFPDLDAAIARMAAAT